MFGLSNAHSTGGYALSCLGSLVAYAANTVRYGCLDGKRALLVEAGATNFLLHNNDFSQNEWVSNSFSDTGMTTTAPDGTSTPVYSLGDGYILQNLSGPTEGGSYTTSVWIKANKAGVVGLRNLGRNSDWNININLTTDWLRYEVTLEGFDGFTPKVVIDNRAESGYGVSGLELSIWGWQVEENVLATSEIITGGAAASRAADIVTTPLTSDYSNGVRVRGTFRLDAVRGNSDRVFQVDNGEQSGRMFLAWAASQERFYASIYSGNDLQGLTFIDAAGLGDVVDFDVTFSASGISATFNGEAVSGAFSGSYTPPTVARIGHDFAGIGIPARLLCSKFIVTGVSA